MDNRNENEGFSFTYSAKEQEELRKIRQKYAPSREDKMEQLRRLTEVLPKKERWLPSLSVLSAR